MLIGACLHPLKKKKKNLLEGYRVKPINRYGTLDDSIERNEGEFLPETFSPMGTEISLPARMETGRKNIRIFSPL